MLITETSPRKQMGKALTYTHTVLFQTFNFQLKKIHVCNYKGNPHVARFCLRGALGFSVLRFWIFFLSVFVSKDVGFLVLVFSAVC